MTSCPFCGAVLIRGIGCVAHGEPREAAIAEPIVTKEAHKRWSEEHAAFAIDHMATMTSKEIGEHLHYANRDGEVVTRSEKSVKHWFAREGISKPRVRGERVMRPRPVREDRHNRWWTEEEIWALESGELTDLCRCRKRQAVLRKARREGYGVSVNDGCLSVREAAELYSLDPWRVIRRIQWGELPATRWNARLWRIDPADAERVLSPLSPIATHPRALTPADDRRGAGSPMRARSIQPMGQR